MKKNLWQLIVILTLSLFIGLGYNQFSKSPLPLFQKYNTRLANISTNNDSKETLIIHFNDIDAETLQSLLESSLAILLDARELREFQNGYIPGAVSFPISQFKEKFNSLTNLLSEGETIITYCEDIHCTDSSMLAKELYKKGYTDIFIYKVGMDFFASLPVQILCCLILGGMFIYAGTIKIIHPHAFAKIVYNYKLLPDNLIYISAIILPWVELISGLFLVAGIFKRTSAIVLSLLLLIFILAISINLIRGLNFDCGCFSTISIKNGSDPVNLLIRDILLLIPGVIVISKRLQNAEIGN